jgi:mannose-6-phosphate isomerase
MDIDSFSFGPLKLKYTRVFRNFTGGFLLDQFQKNQNPLDGKLPEEWVASTVEARNDNYVANEGLSQVEDDASREFLRDIVNQNPEAFLGKDHFKKYSANTSVLVKLIDSCSRLYLQVHPDGSFAKEVFGCNFGKTEAWYIIGGRAINGREPYVLLGFKEGMTKEKWKLMFEKQDIEGMVNSLHCFPVSPGDIFFIESGVPHAIGSGCFLIEVQEPTDYTFRVERTTPEGKKLPDSFCHQGAGFDKMLDSFHYDTYTRDEILKKWHLKPFLLEIQDGGTKSCIIDSPYFSMKKLSLTGSFHDNKGDVFAVAVILSGQGNLSWAGGNMAIGQADELFLPAGLKDMEWQSINDQKLEIILCYPPKS